MKLEDVVDKAFEFIGIFAGLPYPLNIIAFIILVAIAIIFVVTVVTFFLTEVVFGLMLFILTTAYVEFVEPNLKEKMPYLPLLGAIAGLVMGSLVKKFRMFSFSMLGGTAVLLEYFIVVFIVIAVVYMLYLLFTKHEFTIKV